MALLAVLALGSCAAPSFQTGDSATGRSSYAQAPQDRPGLGTKWGETRKSTVVGASFLRAKPPEPLVSASIYYNDRAGIEAMASASRLRRDWPAVFGPAASLVSVGVRDQSGIAARPERR